MAELRLQRKRRYKKVNWEDDYIMRLSAATYRSVSFVSNATGMTLKDTISTLVEFAMDNLTIVDNIEADIRQEGAKEGENTVENNA